MSLKTTIAFACAAVLAVSGALRADVKPAALFSDHMVLQQGMSVPVWGWADPGEQVTVTLANMAGWTNYPPLKDIPQSQTATAGADGKWMVKLNNLSTAGALEMTIAGKNTIKISDVMVGEVWLGSGQSNMEFTVSKNLEKYPNQAKRFSGVIDEEKEISAANYPNIRMFTVRMKMSKDPLPDVEGKWEVCTPETVPGFSAVGYFFSRELQKSINRRVGFINTSYGASCAQAWISKEALEADLKFKPVLDDFSTRVRTYEEAMAARANNPQPAPPATQPGGRRGGARGPANPFNDQHQPMVLWNAMLKGVQPYAIKGVLWYQGESITTGGPALYTEIMDALILSWRKEWGQPNLPFYFVQLAALDNNSNRPEVREAQAKSLRVPNTAMAVTIDIGNKTDVHPHNKQDLGARLARIARARDYGEKIEYSGPMYASMSAEGNAIRVKFSHVGGGLLAKDGELKWFEIAGMDGEFHPAAAKIDGGTVLVSAPGINEPTAVRYAWHRWPEGANLYNADDLPAAPFRSNAE